MAVRVPIKKNDAALPPASGKILCGAFHQTAVGIGDDELHAIEAAIDQVAEGNATSRTRPPWRLRNTPKNLPKTFAIDGALPQATDVADLAGPGSLHWTIYRDKGTDAHPRCGGSAKPRSWRYLFVQVAPCTSG